MFMQFQWGFFLNFLIIVFTKQHFFILSCNSCPCVPPASRWKDLPRVTSGKLWRKSRRTTLFFFFLTFLPQGLGGPKRFAKKVKRLGRDIAEVKKGTANTVSQSRFIDQEKWLRSECPAKQTGPWAASQIHVLERNEEATESPLPKETPECDLASSPKDILLCKCPRSPCEHSLSRKK